MKKTKLCIFTVLFFGLSLFFTSNVFAVSKYYFSVGTDYGNLGGDSTKEANWVAGTLSLNHYLGSTATAPVYSSFNSKYMNRYTLESDILYFLGHANSNSISWNYQAKNGEYAVGIVNANTDKTYYGNDSAKTPYKMTGIGRYNLSKVNLAIFQGCNTAADTNNNLPKYAVSQGVTVAIGWSTEIDRNDSLPWIKNFFSPGMTLGTTRNVTNMVNYANSFRYTTTEIKNTRIYGNGDTLVIPSSSKAARQVYNMNIDHRRYIINQVFNTNDLGTQELDVVKDKISKIITKNIDSNFNSNNYVIEKAQNDSGKIYDLYFTISGIKTNLGYTIFTNNKGTVITDIYDNMNNYNAQELATNKMESIQKKMNKLDDLSSNKLNKVVLQKAKSENIGNIEIKDTFKYYNVDEEKLYQVVLIKIKSSINTSSLIEYFEEIK